MKLRSFNPLPGIAATNLVLANRNPGECVSGAATRHGYAKYLCHCGGAPMRDAQRPVREFAPGAAFSKDAPVLLKLLVGLDHVADRVMGREVPQLNPAL